MIDADALRAVFPEPKDWRDPEQALVHITGIWAEIDNAPTIEPERKKGKWVHGREIAREMVGDAITAIFYEGWQCSECKCIVEEEREPLWNYCPNCGAYMGGDT